MVLRVLPLDREGVVVALKLGLKLGLKLTLGLRLVSVPLERVQLSVDSVALSSRSGRGGRAVLDGDGDGAGDFAGDWEGDGAGDFADCCEDAEKRDRKRSLNRKRDPDCWMRLWDV